jgi:hypothetical protein
MPLMTRERLAVKTVSKDSSSDEPVARVPTLRLISDFYRAGVAALRRGDMSVWGWAWFTLLCVSVLGDEGTTGYMITHGFNEGNPVAAAGFSGVGFAAFAIVTGVMYIVLLAPIIAGKPRSRYIATLQWAAYFCILAKSFAVVNNVLLYEHLWRGVRIQL